MLFIVEQHQVPGFSLPGALEKFQQQLGGEHIVIPELRVGFDGQLRVRSKAGHYGELLQFAVKRLNMQAHLQVSDAAAVIPLAQLLKDDSEFFGGVLSIWIGDEGALLFNAPDAPFSDDALTRRILPPKMVVRGGSEWWRRYRGIALGVWLDTNPAAPDRDRWPQIIEGYTHVYYSPPKSRAHFGAAPDRLAADVAFLREMDLPRGATGAVMGAEETLLEFARLLS